MIGTPFLYHFIGAWAYSPSNISIPDVQFCKAFFDNSESTKFGTQNETFFIRTEIINSPLNNELLTITNQQLLIVTPNLNKISSYLTKIKDKIIENNIGLNFSFLGCSFTVDIEIINEKDEAAGTIISNSFIKNIPNLYNQEFKSFTTDIAFELHNTKNDNRYAIQMQPRVTNLKNIFFRIVQLSNASDLNQDISKDITLYYTELERISMEFTKNLI